ncbi:MAG: HAD hydrolase-like protein [Bacteroidales bacterium]|nr:HAD hydrolase-like protein [Bacteroidales bacterium]
MFHIVFDFDGTLADTLELGLNVYNRLPRNMTVSLSVKGAGELFRTKRPRELFEAHVISRLKLLTLVMRIRKEINRHVPEMKLFRQHGKGSYAISAKQVSGWVF